MYITSYEHILLYPYGYIYIVNYTIYSVSTQQILMKDWVIGQKVCVTNPNKLENL